MYSVFQETWNEGNIQGRAKEIIEMGQEFGLSEPEILGRLRKKLSISQEQAQNYMRDYRENKLEVFNL